MTAFHGFVDGTGSAFALFIVGAALVICGGSACWCKFARWRGGAGCSSSSRRW